MPSDGRTDWYLGGLVVGTALVFFLLGATATLWLGRAAPSHDIAIRTAAGPTAAGSVGGAAAPAANEGALDRRSSTKGAPVARAAPAAAPPAAPAAIPAAADAAAPGLPAAAPPATAPPAGSAAAAAPADGTAAPAGDFGLQFGAFLDSANATSLLNQLAVRGYKAASVEVPDGEGQIWHYIRLGSFADERTAAAAASAMLDKTGIGAAVIRLSAANAGG